MIAIEMLEVTARIAFLAGRKGFAPNDPSEMYSNFENWALEFVEKHKDAEYDSCDELLNQIVTFADRKLAYEAIRGYATIDEEYEFDGKASIGSLEDWKSLGSDAWVYLADHGDEILTKKYFEDLVNGDARRAFALFAMCEWQAPETIIDESDGLENLFPADVWL